MNGLSLIATLEVILLLATSAIDCRAQNSANVIFLGNEHGACTSQGVVGTAEMTYVC
jgi:hypothetical protein